MGKVLRNRVLIITYYWPPAGGVAVQRWLKFVKYLREYGWEPVVYTPENPETFYDDLSLLKDIPAGIEVIKRPIWEPYNIYKILTGKKGKKLGLGFASNETSSKKGLFNKLFVWLRGNLLIPDPRVFWVSPSVRFLCRYLKEKPVDVIITTGPPHSMHLIGLKLKKKCSIPWIADFRDPWTNIDFYHELKLTWLADWFNHCLERRVVNSADAVLVVSQQMKREFESLGCQRVFVVTNGYDTDDFQTMESQESNSFAICHVGTMNAARNPLVLWKALSRMRTKNPELASKLKIRIAGQVDSSVTESIKAYQLIDNLEYLGVVPHSKALELQKSSQVLLLVVNNTPNAKGIVTGKFFEYLAAGKRVLAIGPTDGDLADILAETGAGDVVDFSDIDKAVNVLNRYFKLFAEGKLTPERKGIEKYSRKELTGQLARILNEISNGR